MIRRAAACLGLLAFGTAWVSGVLHGVLPWTRLVRSSAALCGGIVLGAACAALVQRLLLGALAPRLEPHENPRAKDAS